MQKYLKPKKNKENSEEGDPNKLVRQGKEAVAEVLTSLNFDKDKHRGGYTRYKDNAKFNNEDSSERNLSTTDQ